MPGFIMFQRSPLIRAFEHFFGLDQMKKLNKKADPQNDIIFYIRLNVVAKKGAIKKYIKYPHK